MRRVRPRCHKTSLLRACALMALLVGGCEQADVSAPVGTITAQTEVSATPVSQTPQPAREPLLLLDDPEANEFAGAPAADNSRCFVCHINYATEEIAMNHARRNIGCAHCHGASDPHIADESWGSGGNGTAPDIMYPRDRINPSCMVCHPKEKIDHPQHERVFVASDAKVCTDCHGHHRLSTRRCKWR